MLGHLTRDWDARVVHAELLARSDGFQKMRDRILELAAPDHDSVVVDVGAGTGLLALEVAERARRVWAFDKSPRMCDYLRTKAISAELPMAVAVGCAESLPLVDGAADIVVSNYCFHHLSHGSKERALAEAFRVLRPGGRLVFGDMMFNLSPLNGRSRGIIAAKAKAMVQRGPEGVLRLGRNALRIAVGQWERPAGADWWQGALARAAFIDVSVEVLGHEGGIASARRPLSRQYAACMPAPQGVSG